MTNGLAELEARVGPTHRDVATLAQDLARIHFEDENTRKALYLFERAWRVWRQIEGRAGPNLLMCQQELALCLHKDGQHMRAEAMYDSAMSGMAEVTERYARAAEKEARATQAAKRHARALELGAAGAGARKGAGDSAHPRKDDENVPPARSRTAARGEPPTREAHPENARVSPTLRGARARRLAPLEAPRAARADVCDAGHHKGVSGGDGSDGGGEETRLGRRRVRQTGVANGGRDADAARGEGGHEPVRVRRREVRGEVQIEENVSRVWSRRAWHSLCVPCVILLEYRSERYVVHRFSRVKARRIQLSKPSSSPCSVSTRTTCSR